MTVQNGECVDVLSQKEFLCKMRNEEQLRVTSAILYVVESLLIHTQR